MKSVMVALVLATSVASVAAAQDYAEYPAPTPFYPYQRSRLTGRFVVIPPYDRVFPVRVYTTPPRQPYYNVPPYAVVTPY